MQLTVITNQHQIILNDEQRSVLLNVNCQDDLLLINENSQTTHQLHVENPQELKTKS